MFVRERFWKESMNRHCLICNEMHKLLICLSFNLMLFLSQPYCSIFYDSQTAKIIDKAVTLDEISEAETGGCL